MQQSTDKDQEAGYLRLDSLEVLIIRRTQDHLETRGPSELQRKHTDPAGAFELH